MTYSYWESRKRNPKNIQQIAKFFNVSTDYLLGNSHIRDKIQFDEYLEKSLDAFKYFDGKPMYDEDHESFRNLLKNRKLKR